VPAAIANWFATLAAGVSPEALHRFLAAYVRYQNHVYAYLFLIADPFPASPARRAPGGTRHRGAPPASGRAVAAAVRAFCVIALRPSV
jgi:Domain of unknown function (DUF4389)